MTGSHQQCLEKSEYALKSLIHRVKDGCEIKQSVFCRTDTVSDNQANSSRFRQSQHGHDSVVATVLSVDMKVALLKGKKKPHTHI